MGRYTAGECHRHVGEQCARTDAHRAALSAACDDMLCMANTAQGEQVRALVQELGERLKALDESLRSESFA